MSAEQRDAIDRGLDEEMAAEREAEDAMESAGPGRPPATAPDPAYKK